MFKPAQGMKYQRFLSRLHEAVLFDWYLEIGCRKGTTFAAVRGKTIAVDPFFRVEQNVLGPKPALFLHQQTSDDFFASGFLHKLGIRLSFSFLDGMHLFEFLLRDFINTEAASRADGIIALHDCCPFSHEMTTRDLDRLPRGFWTGDVWKLIPILREYRPDLTVTVLDCAPTGLVLVSGLDPENRVLSGAMDEIVARYRDQTLEAFGLERFNGLFDYVDARRMFRQAFAMFQPLALDPASLVLPVPVTP